MQTLYLFKGVPFDRTYTDVIRFKSRLDAFVYLTSNYQYISISNISRYNLTTTQIKIEKAYYDAYNYVVVYDSDITDYRFNFIINEDVSATNTITYDLQLDVWTTFASTITMFNSNIIGGHKNEYSVNSFACNIQGVECESNPFTRLTSIFNKNTDGKYTLLVKISTNDNIIRGDYTNTVYRLLGFYGTLNEVIDTLQCLIYCGKVKAFYNGSGVYSSFEYTISITDVFVLPYDCVRNVSSDWTWTAFKNNPIGLTGYYYEIGANNLLTLYNWTYTLNVQPNKKYYIGAISNGINITNQNTSIGFRFNITTTLYGDVNIRLFYSDNVISFNEDFSIDYLEISSFAQWYYQNKNQLKIANKQNYVSGMFNVVGGITSVAMGTMTGNPMAIVGGISSATQGVSGVILGKANQNAKIKDMKNVVNNRQNTNSDMWLNIDNGVFLDTISYDNDDTLTDDINYNGYMFNIISVPYLPLETTTYNFYVVHTSGCKLTAETTHDYIDDLQRIFNNGVRIWYNADAFLTSVNYIRS